MGKPRPDIGYRCARHALSTTPFESIRRRIRLLGVARRIIGSFARSWRGMSVPSPCRTSQMTPRGARATRGCRRLLRLLAALAAKRPVACVGDAGWRDALRICPGPHADIETLRPVGVGSHIRRSAALNLFGPARGVHALSEYPSACPRICVIGDAERPGELATRCDAAAAASKSGAGREGWWSNPAADVGDGRRGRRLQIRSGQASLHRGFEIRRRRSGLHPDRLRTSRHDQQCGCQNPEDTGKSRTFGRHLTTPARIRPRIGEYPSIRRSPTAGRCRATSGARDLRGGSPGTPPRRVGPPRAAW
jgi:hypothetical protein